MAYLLSSLSDIPISVYFLLLIPAFFIFVFVTSMCERQFLAGDIEPVHEPFPFEPLPYWSATKQDAARLGFRHEGDYATKKQSSVVKGLESIWTNPERTVIVSIIGGAFSGMKTRRTILRSRLQDGRILESADESGLVDLGKTVDRAILLNASLQELMAFHLQRVIRSGSFLVPFDGPALAAIEEIALQRGNRMVELGYAKWADPGHTTIRMTLSGASANLVQSFFKQTGKLQNQSHRMDIPRAGSR